MYIYEVGYHDYDSSEYWQLTHKEKFTKEQFDKMVEEALFAALLRICEPKSEWKNQRNPPYYRLMIDRIRRDNKKTKKTSYTWPFMDAMKKFGFSLIEFEQKLSIFGHASSVNPRKKGEEKEIINRSRRLKRRLLKEKPHYRDYFKKGIEKEKKMIKERMKRYEKSKDL